MKPDEINNSQGGMSLSQQGSHQNTPKQDYRHTQDAAASMIRSQIDSIYSGQSEPQDKPDYNKRQQFEYTSPYERSHSQNPQPQASDWKQYHTAWQNYYQKYYEGYYKHATKNQTDQEEKPLSNEDQISDIRRKLLGKISHSAVKVRKSKHFIPLISGFVVVLVFAFLQYNRILIANVVAYVSPGSIEVQNIVVDPNAAIDVGPDPKLIIPKINVDVPVIYDVGNDNKSQLNAMKGGVAQFAVPGASSHPGEMGNTVIAGHSSNDLFDSGDYKFIFAQLDKLEPGDTIYANYKSKRYTYIVTKKEVVKPKDVNKLVYNPPKPTLTLITCTPLGTATNRLLITAEQVSPDPSIATKAPENDKVKTESIPGSSPTLFERLFGG